MHRIELPADYALVLQQVEENGQEDFAELAESLYFDRARLSHIISSLKHKGLVRVSYTAQDTWISLSTKGHRLVQSMWPECRPQYGSA